MYGIRQPQQSRDERSESDLHPSLEEAIQFKSLLARARGLNNPDEIPQLDIDATEEARNGSAKDMSSEEDEDSDDESQQLKKKNQKKANNNKKRKEKKKRAKQRKRDEREKENEFDEETDTTEQLTEAKDQQQKVSFWSQPAVPKMEPIDLEDQSGAAESQNPDDEVEIVYVEESPSLDQLDSNYSYFMKVFEAFKIGESSKHNEEFTDRNQEPKQEPAKPVHPKEPKNIRLEDDDEDERDKPKEGDPPKISKRKLKEMMRPSIAALKAQCPRPDVVEWHDVTARDPKLLVHLKATRNTVPVPRHWCFKRKYLAGKRGFEKPAFQLPEFIRKTGIMEMREALQEKEDAKAMKAKMREKVRPKLGKIDIDYQKLHDAFFRWQTKPRMTAMGELYYEGKEFEAKMKDKKPGDLSDDLRVALGMPLGPNAFKFPPPWLIAMQRYGPPPSYPNLKIPGLNAPIPEGCSFGYHPGGWGKPPVDEMGKPLYGDVFGVDFHAQNRMILEEEEIDRTPWGELESESESEEEEEESEEEEEGGVKEKEPDVTGLETPATGLITPSGMSSSVTAGLETPDTVIELRKRKAAEEGGETPSLFTVLPEKRVDRIGGQMMASTHVYDLATSAKKPGEPGRTEGVEVALNPEELELDPAAMTARYEETLRAQQLGKEEDFSDMVAEHAARQKKKRKQQEEKKTSQQSKKHKEFKF